MPSTSTIRRILHAAGLVVPEPRKRPRSSWIRFEAAAPNELWQSDFTHWRLADGNEVEIISWLDDHSRYLLGITACSRVSGDDVVATLQAAGEAHGWPAATLTDNAAVYTVALHRRAQRLRVPARLPRHPPEERLSRSSPDAGQDRALPPDPQALAGLPAARRAAWPSCRRSSMPSASSTTSSGRTGPSVGITPAEAYAARPKADPGRAWRCRATSGCATTASIGMAASACAGPGACITWGSVPPTPVGGSWPSSTSARSASSRSTRASSCPPIGSSPRRATGATSEETPADGRGPRRPSDATARIGVADVPTHVSHMSRLKTMVSRRWDSNPGHED